MLALTAVRTPPCTALASSCVFHLTAVKPTLHCPRELLANHFDADVMVKCTARANPALTHHAVYWSAKSGRNVTLHEDGEATGRYKFHAAPGVGVNGV